MSQRGQQSALVFCAIPQLHCDNIRNCTLTGRSSESICCQSVGCEPVGCQSVGCEPVGCQSVGCEPVGCQSVGCQSVGCQSVGCNLSLGRNTKRGNQPHR